MNTDKFILVRKSRFKQRNDRRAVIRVSEASYNALCAAAAETGRSIMSIADSAIMFAMTRMQVVDEDGE